ncbi:OLC1v1034494C2 [Oldenlandia corymbosa var. corymbosa]|uniref:OLC1v1034494C2 n=1 Tax=Oldenlandia corymbosa var. corymbosa TaxID=529605 RepID=A0AAV1CTL1_OLDCO|nr:OLC1v1034494C2 [Oldenlandia corymbosa var. corymbosa]
MLSETTAFRYFSTVSSIPSINETATNNNQAFPSSSFLKFCKFPPFNPNSPHHRRPKSVRFVARASGSGHFFADDAYGPFPWESSDSGDSSMQWVPEERVTLFTADGLVHLGGNLVPRRTSVSDKKFGKLKTSQRFQKFQESDYMDPNQVLCLGALFDIAATNGLDTGRRLCIFGFCRSIEMLSDVVEDTVLEHGGEVCPF